MANPYSFCELMKYLLTYYVGISYENASEIASKSRLAEPVASVMEAGLYGHEYPYYWAMNLYYGTVYWKKEIGRAHV